MKKKSVRSSHTRSVSARKTPFRLTAVIGWIVAIELVGAVGSVFTVPSIPTWYAALVKPSFSPPNWLFGPVWTILYAMMGVAGYRIYRLGIKKLPVLQAMVFFGVQLFLNALWSPIFFGVRNIPLAFIDISMLWILILLTILRFKKLDETGAWLMVPYFLWVSFATVLNYHLWLLNG